MKQQHNSSRSQHCRYQTRNGGKPLFSDCALLPRAFFQTRPLTAWRKFLWEAVLYTESVSEHLHALCAVRAFCPFPFFLCVCAVALAWCWWWSGWWWRYVRILRESYILLRKVLSFSTGKGRKTRMLVRSRAQSLCKEQTQHNFLTTENKIYKKTVTALFSVYWRLVVGGGCASERWCKTSKACKNYFLYCEKYRYSLPDTYMSL